MGQQSLIYAFVAHGTVILAEYTEFTDNFTTIASQCLMKLPASNNKFTYNCDGHTFNYLVKDGFSELSCLPQYSFLLPLLAIRCQDASDMS
jgi:vesicle-associated membrane protein 72